jgi:hypothetical protein
MPRKVEGEWGLGLVLCSEKREKGSARKLLDSSCHRKGAIARSQRSPNPMVEIAGNTVGYWDGSNRKTRSTDEVDSRAYDRGDEVSMCVGSMWRKRASFLARGPGTHRRALHLRLGDIDANHGSVIGERCCSERRSQGSECRIADPVSPWMCERRTGPRRLPAGIRIVAGGKRWRPRLDPKSYTSESNRNGTGTQETVSWRGKCRR